MANTVAAIKNPSQVERLAQIKIPNKKLNAKDKFDFQKPLELYRPQTDILDIIRKNDPKKSIYVTITPEIALDLLTLNDPDHNRDIDTRRIESWVEQMLSGDWKPRNGDTIRISSTMKLIDGQHRLWSIYYSQIPCDYFIITGLDDDVFSHIDVGYNRNAQAITKINGFGTNSGQLSQVVKQIIYYKKTLMVKGTVSERDVKNHEVNKFEQERGRMNRILKDLNGVIKTEWMEKTNDWLTAPQWAFVFYTLRTLPGMDEKAYKFLDQFVQGVNLGSKHPIKILRTYFETDFKHLSKGNGKSKRSNKATLTTKVKYIFAAWDHVVQGDSVSEIKVDLKDPLITKPIQKAV